MKQASTAKQSNKSKTKGGLKSQKNNKNTTKGSKKKNKARSKSNVPRQFRATLPSTSRTNSTEFFLTYWDPAPKPSPQQLFSNYEFIID